MAASLVICSRRSAPWATLLPEVLCAALRKLPRLYLPVVRHVCRAWHDTAVAVASRGRPLRVHARLLCMAAARGYITLALRMHDALAWHVDLRAVELAAWGGHRMIFYALASRYDYPSDLTAIALAGGARYDLVVWMLSHGASVDPVAMTVAVALGDVDLVRRLSTMGCPASTAAAALAIVLQRDTLLEALAPTTRMIKQAREAVDKASAQCLSSVGVLCCDGARAVLTARAALMGDSPFRCGKALAVAVLVTNAVVCYTDRHRLDFAWHRELEALYHMGRDDAGPTHTDLGRAILHRPQWHATSSSLLDKMGVFIYMVGPNARWCDTERLYFHPWEYDETALASRARPLFLPQMRRDRLNAALVPHWHCAHLARPPGATATAIIAARWGRRTKDKPFGTRTLCCSIGHGKDLDSESVLPAYARDQVKVVCALMDTYLADAGRHIECLLGTNLAHAIIDRHDLNHWEEGGCAVLATALVLALRRRGYHDAAVFAVGHSRDGDRVLWGHYVVGFDDDGPFLDRSGWHSREALIAQYADYLTPQSANLQIYVERARAPVGNIDVDRGVICPRGAIADTLDFIETYLDRPFIAATDDYTYECSLWTWSDDELTRVYRDGLLFVPCDGGHDDDNDNDVYDEVMRLARRDPRAQACIELP